MSIVIEPSLFDYIENGHLDFSHSKLFNQKYGGAKWVEKLDDNFPMLPLFEASMEPEVGYCVQIQLNFSRIVDETLFTWIRGVISEVVNEGKVLEVVATYIDKDDGERDVVANLAAHEWKCYLMYDDENEDLYRLVRIEELSEEDSDVKSIARIIEEYSVNVTNPYVDNAKNEYKIGERKITLLKGQAIPEGVDAEEILYIIYIKFDVEDRDVFTLTQIYSDGVVKSLSSSNGDNPKLIFYVLMNSLNQLEEIPPEEGPEIILNDPQQIYFMKDEEPLPDQ